MFDDYAVNSSHERNWGRKLTWVHHGSRKKWIAVLTIVLIISGIFIADSVLKQPGSPSPLLGRDPIKPIWYNTQYVFNPLWKFQGNWLPLGFCFGCQLGLLAEPLPNVTSTAINQNSIDLSTAVAHTLEFWQQYRWTIATGFPGANSYSSFGFFLTRNSTAPSQLNVYDPRTDPNVVLFEKVNATGSASTQAALYHVYIQTDPSASIASQDPGTFNTNDCKSGSQFMCLTTGYNTVLTNLQALTLDLNYTASRSGTSWSQDGIDITGGGVALDQNIRLPPLNLQGSRYYWGLWVDRNIGNNFGQNIVDFTVSPEPPNVNTCGFCGPGLSGNSMLADIYLPPTVVPYLETTGFFGPVIKALVSLGVWIIQSFMAYVGFVLSGVALFLNVIGGFFGAGNIGDALVTFLNGIGSWFLNVVGGGFARIGDLATAAANMISFIAGLFTNGFWNMITGFVSNIISFFGTFKIFWDGFVHLLAVAGLGFSYFFMLDWIYGMWQVRSFGAAEGIGKWFDFNEFLFIKTFRGVYFVVKESAEWIRDIKQTVDPIG